MSPAPRKKGNKDLPHNLSTDKKGQGTSATTYYRYRMPDGKRVSLGKDKNLAIQVARSLNDKLLGDPVGQKISKTISRAQTRNNPTIPELIERFRKEYLPTKSYAERTLKDAYSRLDTISREWSHRRVASVKTTDVAEYLAERTVSSYIKNRHIMVQLFAFAAHMGFIQDNPAARTMPKSDKQRKKKRKKHTVEGYNAILTIAPQYLQNAMELAVYSLQRRGDLLGLTRSDITDGCIRILQSKTRQYAEPVYIDIEMGDELKEVVNRCLNSGILCPNLIHRKPLRTQSREKLNGRHPFALTYDYLTKAFAKFRDQSGVYDHLPKEERPAFHDLRALGIHLYSKSYDEEYINALSGHSSKVMHEHYKEGHEAIAPKRVKAELSLKKRNN